MNKISDSDLATNVSLKWLEEKVNKLIKGMNRMVR